MSDKKEFLWKILLCGDGAVGKTSIREQYMGKGFAGSYMKTIGADFASHKDEIDGHKVTYQIFDLAGQDQYTVARKAFYKGGQAAFLIFDLQDPETMHNLKKWIQDCIDNSDGSIGTFIALGNKADLAETRQVSNDMAYEHFQRTAAQTGITFVFLETSAKTGMNIKLAFDIMGKRLLQKRNIPTQLDLPDGISLIAPGDATSQSVGSEQVAAVAAVAQESTQKVGTLSADMEALLARLDEFDTRIDGLEKRFGKLAQIVRSLVDGPK